MSAKILLIDIETAPNVGYVWGKYDQNVIEFITDWYILSFAYKWLGDTSISVKALPDYRGRKSDPSDRRLVTDIHGLLDNADIVVAHNGDSFDIKKIQTRCLVYGLGPPSDFKTVDTLKVLRKHFKFDSNKLGDVCKALGIGDKVPHGGFALWKGCIELNDPEAWSLMKEYNAQDVNLLEQIYLRIRPWCNHPDVTMFGDSDDVGCPACGSTHIHSRGTAVSRTRKYQRLSCQSCGKWFPGDIVK